MKLNFERFPLYQGIDHSNVIITDVKHAVADGIYNSASGVAAHALALKIYNSSGDEEYNDNEIEMLRNFAKLCTPAFIDSFEKITSVNND